MICTRRADLSLPRRRVQPPCSLVPGVVWGSTPCARGCAEVFQPIPWPWTTVGGEAVPDAARSLQLPMRSEPLLLPSSAQLPQLSCLAGCWGCAGCGMPLGAKKGGSDGEHPKVGLNPLVSAVCACRGVGTTVIQPLASAACGQRPRRAARVFSRFVGVAQRLGKLPA